jgi:hypothetical protein
MLNATRLATAYTTTRIHSKNMMLLLCVRFRSSIDMDFMLVSYVLVVRSSMGCLAAACHHLNTHMISIIMGKC